MRKSPSDNRETMSDKEIIFTDIVSLHHKKRTQAILKSGKNPEKLLSIGLQDGQIPTVKAALESINNTELLRNVANSYSTEIVVLFKKLLKGQAGRSYQHSGGFFWHIDIGGIILLREKFGIYINFDEYIKERLLELIKDVNQIKLASKLILALNDIDFSEDIKKGFEYHTKIQTPIHIDIAILLVKSFGEVINFDETIKSNKELILCHLQKAGKNGNIDQIIAINKCFGKEISLTNTLKEIFINYLKTSYQYSGRILNFLHGVDITNEIKEGFLYRLKKIDIVFAKKIRNDFGKGIDFSAEIIKGIDYLKMKGYINDAIKIQKELL